ncbi:hypothetical protein GQE99_00090 [Maritimibacter sp. DP07]|uniref:Permuted papain-like amidase enzyme, YaeF/YiiX, C92 family n=1 Tax=Maritimibacter harenae TaxID=2606218 RepID=A0A845M5J9_9RHOB|nr:hypothetical protein [Maritimibacter harenae]
MARFLFLSQFMALTACTLPNQHPDYTGLPEGTKASTFTCCEDPDRQPDWFAGLALALSEPLAPLFNAESGSGLLAAHPAAIERVVDKARPLDLLVFSSKSHLSSRMLPGWFTHSAVYIGTEAQLRAIGLWSHPSIKPYHEAIRAGANVVEGVSPNVSFSALSDVLGQRDAALLIRPEINVAQKQTVAARALRLVGRPFDHAYDLNTCDSFACSEVLARSFPCLEFPVRDVQGSTVLLPDDVAAKAIRGEDLRIVDYVEGRGEQWAAPGVTGAMERVAGFWGPTPIGPIAQVSSSHALPTCSVL